MPQSMGRRRGQDADNGVPLQAGLTCIASRGIVIGSDFSPQGGGFWGRAHLRHIPHGIGQHWIANVAEVDQLYRNAPFAACRKVHWPTLGSLVSHLRPASPTDTDPNPWAATPASPVP